MKKLCYLIIAFVVAGCGFDAGENADVSPTGDIGVGGSTARFTIKDDFLYVVNNTELKAIDISDVKNPTLSSTTNMWGGVETIFGYKDHLFIGSQWGMTIYNIRNDGSPSYVSEFRHTTACDPVIANDSYAYVTIRSGVSCSNQLFEANQLITLDITEIEQPFDVDRQQMINPRGLAFFKGNLFVAEGQSGLKQYCLDDPAHPELIHFYQDIAANDMIAVGETLIITRDEGIHQFDYMSTPGNCQTDSIIYLGKLL